ncbi:MAG: biotin/lipoyl-binding protein [Pseudomonas sp.]|uniref:HlyD family secretion protein n=1 Tax=Pseudomonas sp. TaxID=306 RepID=UPI003395EC4B
MKIRFTGDKERNPTQEAGLKVLYAPGKRMAFRLRWYLILLLISSPLLWFFGRLAADYLRIEAPAQIQLPMVELRAREAGTVAELSVKVGDQVRSGQLLLSLDNPEWRLRIQQLQPVEVPASGSVSRPALPFQQRAIDLARQRVSQLQALLAQGAATRGELLTAQADLNAQQQLLLEQDARLRTQRSQAEGDPLQLRREERERQWLQSRLEGLRLNASEDGRVAEVLVGRGENVGPGTVLMRLERPVEPLLLIYLEPRFAAYAAPGQPLQVRLPDGSWQAARVLQAADSARRLPADMQKPFTVSQMGLLVPAEFEQPLSPLWRVDQLPLKVRFPHDWSWLAGFDD